MTQRKYKVTKVIPVKAQVEISVDEKNAMLVFKSKDGREFVLKYLNALDSNYENLAIQEI